MLKIYKNHILIKFISMILLVAIQCGYANSTFVSPSILSKNGKKDSNHTSLLINEHKRRMPNIVLILTDDQGYGDIGKFNNPVVKTPNIDLLANEGISFNNFHVDPTCSPTRAALMTGKHSMRAGVWHTVMGRSILPTEELTLAEILSDVGYTTAIFGKWHLGDSYPFRPQDQGFKFSLIHGGGGVGQTGDYWGNVQFNDTYYRNGTPVKFNGYSTNIWFEEAISFIHEQAKTDEPFFTYIATNAPHTPWRASNSDIQAYRDMGLPESMSRYYAMITSIDSGVGAVRAALEDSGISDNTLVIFMSDNGTASLRPESSIFDNLDVDEFLSEVRANPEFSEWVINGGMRGYKNDVYEGGHRVPFFIYYPNGEFGPSREIKELVAHFDLLPTLVELLGIQKGVEFSDFDGVSFLPLLKLEPSGNLIFDSRKFVVTNQRVPTPMISRPMAVLSKSWRYISDRDLGLEELYNIESDPTQSKNLITTYPEIAREHKAHLDFWWQNISDSIRPTSKVIVGSPHESTTRLNANDWEGAISTDEIAWNPGFKVAFLPETDDGWTKNVLKYKPLPWRVKVATDGIYRISTLVYDKPANTNIDRAYAFLDVEGKIYKKRLSDKSIGGEFKVPLSKGDVSIKAWFGDSEGNKLKTKNQINLNKRLATNNLPAFYAYITKL